MRSEIGKLTLDGLFSEREELNSRICSSINEASLEWGMSALRYEIKDIEVRIVLYRTIMIKNLIRLVNT